LKRKARTTGLRNGSIESLRRESSFSYTQGKLALLLVL
jgi:hypothetical protein